VSITSQPTRRTALTAALAAIVLLAACGSSSSASSKSSNGTTKPAAAAAKQLYVSLGDSYAVGYQPTGTDTGATTTNGYAYQLPALVTAKGYHLQLENFGCIGATTASITAEKGCDPRALGPKGVPYPDQTQADAAIAYIHAHAGKVALVTVSIGGNDVTSCAKDPSPIPCVSAAVEGIKKNLGTMLTRIRAAAGPNTTIIGITYPDVILGAYLQPSPSAKDLAKLSVTAFQSVINPALAAQYQAVDGTFVDITKATGAYGSFDETTDLAPYGVIPTPVAKVCELTYFCQYTDIHPKTSGYTLIARQIADAMPKAAT
jgi:lysophospholipase L1-like esterase